MIQRMQSVYFLLTIIFAVLFLTGDIITFENGTLIQFIGFTDGNTDSVIERAWPVSALLLMVPVLAFILIFLYRNRKTQLRITVLLIVLIVALIGALGWYAIDHASSAGTIIVPGYKLALPLLMLITSVLAYRGIRKDEEIVRSYDRLR